MKKFIIIQNMKSRGRSLKRNYIESLLNKQGVEFELFQTHNIYELENIISNYKDSSKYQYCTIGGDGSLNALVNALFKHQITLPSVSCLPAGSGSDFIRIFGLPQKFEESISRLNHENYYKIDVGLVKNEHHQKYFLNVLNIGFLASTVNLSEKLPNFFKRFRYPLSFWLKLLPHKPTEVMLDTNRYKFTERTFNICICNGQFFGGGWNISPKSSLQDGIFNVQSFAVKKTKAMKIFFLAKKGLHLREQGVIVKKASNLKLNTPDPIEIDGDFFGFGPAEIFIKNQPILFKI